MDKYPERLAVTYGVHPEAIHEAIRRGLISFENRKDVPCWRYGDTGNAILRKLDGRRFPGRSAPKALALTKGAAWHRPIGLNDVVSNGRRDVVMVLEGSKDALAAFHLAHLDGNASVGIVAMLGAAAKLAPEHAEKFRGHRVRIFGDDDEAGRKVLARIGGQLARVADAVDVFSFAGLHRADGEPVNDLFDLLSISADDHARHPEISAPTNLDQKGDLVRVIAPEPDLLANGNSNDNAGGKKGHFYTINAGIKSSSDQGLKAIMHTEHTEHSEYSEEGEKVKRKTPLPFLRSVQKGRPMSPCAKLVMPCIPTARGQTNEMLFKLARALRVEEEQSQEPIDDLRRQCAARWLRETGANCSPEMRAVEIVDEYLKDRMNRVKKPVSKVVEAVSRAIELLPHEPEVIHPYLAGNRNPKLERLARGCRILGRSGPFLLPSRQAARIIGLGENNGASVANLLLKRLEDEHIIRCEERGLKGQNSGKASIFNWIGPTA